MTFEDHPDAEIQLLSESLNRAHEAASTEVIASDNGILVEATLASSSSSDDNWAGDAVDGTYLKPPLIFPRKTIESQPMEQGVNDDQCLMVYQENGFVCLELFERWCLEVFSGSLAAGGSTSNSGERRS
jgi:hypothetical protein